MFFASLCSIRFSRFIHTVARRGRITVTAEYCFVVELPHFVYASAVDVDTGVVFTDCPDTSNGKALAPCSPPSGGFLPPSCCLSDHLCQPRSSSSLLLDPPHSSSSCPTRGCTAASAACLLCPLPGRLFLQVATWPTPSSLRALLKVTSSESPPPTPLAPSNPSPCFIFLHGSHCCHRLRVPSIFHPWSLCCPRAGLVTGT